VLLIPFHNLEGIIAGFGNSSYEYDSILREKQVMYNAASIKLENLWFAEQVHGDGIAVLPFDLSANRTKESPNVFPDVDALVTDTPGLYLAVKYADCIPILIYDKKKKVIAGVHSGRKGTEQNIVGKTISRLNRIYLSEPSDLYVALGPSICGEHYEVSDDIFEKFVSNTEIEQRYPTLDLRKVVKHQLMVHGVSEKRVFDYPICTFEDHNYHSYRRDKTTKRQIAIMGMCNG